MKAYPNVAELNSGRIKSIIYTNNDNTIPLQTRPIINKLYKLSNMDNLKVVYIMSILPSSGKLPIEVLQEYCDKYFGQNNLYIMDSRIANQYYDTSTKEEFRLFEEQVKNIGFYNVIWNVCMGNQVYTSTHWFILGNKYGKNFIEERTGLGDGKLIRRYYTKTEEDSISEE